MKIAVLMTDNNLSKSPISKHEPQINPMPYLKRHIAHAYYLSKTTAIDILKIISSHYDVFLNLCDGSNDDDRPGIEVVQFFEKQKLAFTGANSNFYDPSRQAMKEAAKMVNVPIPNSMFIYSLDELDNVSFNFPCIVKHPKSYSSIGLTKKSIVYNLTDLKYQTKRMLQMYKGALIEKFIEGKEYTVLVCSVSQEKVIAFPPAEIIFPEGENFKHFNLKWKKHSSMKYISVSNTELSEKLKNYSIAIYKQLQGNGYARFDFRVDINGTIYFIELNPNCSVFYPDHNASSADEILKLSDSKQLFVDTILSFAMQRF